KEECNHQKNQNRATRMCVIQIELRIGLNGVGRSSPPPPSFQGHAEYNYGQTKHENRGKNYVSEDPYIRILNARGNLDEEQEGDTCEAGENDRQADKADVVAEQGGPLLDRWN